MNISKKIFVFCLSLLFLSALLSGAGAEDKQISIFNARVNNIASRLEPSTGMMPRFIVTPDSSKSAYVLPDKTIMVSTGLLSACESDDEIAFVIAHEISHIKAGDMKKYSENGLSSLNGYQSHETDADIHGILFIKEAGFNPAASLSLLNRIFPVNVYSKNRLSALADYLKVLK